jgi:hypothetical protein
MVDIPLYLEGGVEMYHNTTMGYESGKIYKLQCSDGCFYIGSTINKLNTRFYHHKTASRSKNTPLYSHILQTIGWGNVRIVLLEEFGCANRVELRRREDELIENERGNPLCLNKNKAIIEETTKDTYTKEYHKDYNSKNKEHISAQKKEYKSKNKEIIREKSREYYQQNKERILLQQREYHTNKKPISV